MKGYVANTDFDWYEFLRERPELDEVNFWQPSGGRAFHAIPSGAPFFFRLKSPHNAIGGFGFLAYHDTLPAWLAWDTFGVANGASNREEMYRRIARYRHQILNPETEYIIGCLMIVSPIFFEPSKWIREPEGWHANIVQGKSIDLTHGDGLRLWEECQAQGQITRALQGSLAESNPRYGDPVEIRPRLGQGSFRIAVMEAYDRACAITTEHSLPVLDSAHIKRYRDGGEHEISNGIFLRSDIHRLFDKGYVTLTSDFRFSVSNRLKEDYANGKSYYGLHGKRLQLPKHEQHWPSRDMLMWHNENLYLG